MLTRIRMARAGRRNDDGLWFYLTLLTTFFLLLEISFFITCNKAYLEDFTHVTADLSIPHKVWLGVSFYILAEIALHAVYLSIVLTVTFLISRLFVLPAQQKLYLGIVVWCIGIFTILLLNLYKYPNSKFSELLAIIFFNTVLIKIILYPLLWTVACILLLALLEVILEFPLKLFLLSIFVLLAFGFLQFGAKKTIAIDGATSTKPNIILIGIDALRPDFLSFFGHENTTAFFDQFLTEATVFTDAITPLARTFPSWTSILTGQYPLKSGVRFNLTNPKRIMLHDTLPNLLKQFGYKTAYATDETRFSNIDHYFGFDEIITPPMGVNDFIIGTFNDFPLSNLLVNTFIGKWLFPYSYANRGVYFTYQPKIFVDQLSPFLAMPRSKPLFLSIHFCLTHYPNLWAGASVADKVPLELYELSVLEVEKQIQLFMELLNQNNVLKHAIVVLLSDHGEGLAMAGDRITERDLFIDLKHKAIPQFYPASIDHEAVNQSIGHGTDVLGLPQYHVLLAFKLYGFKSQHYREVSQLVTLIDIKPTILDLLGLNKTNTDGVSLAQFIISDRLPHLSRSLFLESDYSPESIRTIYPEVRRVMLDGIRLFEIDPKTTRLTIKDEMGTMILASKQHAVIDGEWILALYPQNKIVRLPILVNLKTGEWTDDLHSQFAKKSPAQKMLSTLKSFYGRELTGI